MIPELYWLESPLPGRLAIALRPRGGEWIEDEARGFLEAGAGTVVSMLTASEAVELQLETEDVAFRAAGVEFLNLPIPDRGTPQSDADAARTVETILERLIAGRNVAVHCRQGIGRSAMIAAAVLVAGGEHPGDAWQRVRAARGAPVPDTDAQRDWVYRFAAAHRVS